MRMDQSQTMTRSAPAAVAVHRPPGPVHRLLVPARRAVGRGARRAASRADARTAPGGPKRPSDPARRPAGPCGGPDAGQARADHG